MAPRRSPRVHPAGTSRPNLVLLVNATAPEPHRPGRILRVRDAIERVLRMLAGAGLADADCEHGFD